jgi:hypothetical protein
MFIGLFVEFVENMVLEFEMIVGFDFGVFLQDSGDLLVGKAREKKEFMIVIGE